jgi:hypothetical protein
MPSPIPQPIREAIICRVRRNQDAATIARALHLCPRTVRHLIRRFQQQPDAIEPSYRPGPGRPKDSQSLHDRAVALREEHPTWGAGYIRVRMGAADLRSVPSERTLQRWFRQERQPPSSPGRRPTAEGGRGTHPHQGWQMDAVEQLRLGSKQGVCWLRFVDEYSGAFLSTTVFPPLFLGSRPGIGHSAATASGLCPLGPASEDTGR